MMPDTNLAEAIDARALAGYRRRIVIEPGEGAVVAMLEDDIHAMAVRLRHDGTRVLTVEPVIERMPWTTCPGAAEALVATFTGLALADVTARRAKKQNCTHLHDLAVLAAAHAYDRATIDYAIAVSDPVEGTRHLQLRRDGALVLDWTESAGRLVGSESVAGETLLGLRERIAALPPAEREAARLLQWGALVAHGRTMPLDQQSEASSLPPNCYTFQPERAVHARRVGKILDFSSGERVPLETLRKRAART